MSAPHLLGLLLASVVFVAVVVTCDREWRHRRAEQRHDKRWRERHERDAAEAEAKRLKVQAAAGRAAFAAEIERRLYPLTPLPRRTALR